MTGWHHAPPHGSRSGVADYAHRLGNALQPHWDPDTHLYHIGNNGLHRDIYTRAIERPGIVVLHDAVLNHLLLGTLDRDRYIEEFVHNYGEWRRDFAVELWERRASSGVDPRYFEFGMLRRVVEAARLVVVHNPGAARLALEHGAGQVVTIPHFFEFDGLPDACDGARFRQRLGIAPSTLLFACFGYLRETKRLGPTIGAFRKLNAIHPDCALLLAGEPFSPALERYLASEARHPAIFRLGHMPERDLLVAAEAVDCCVNLRYPAAGETSGIAIRLMGIGKPVILSEGQETSDFPLGACMKVRSGVSEEPELFELMALLVAAPELRRAIGSAARHHMATHHNFEVVVEKYLHLLRR